MKVNSFIRNIYGSRFYFHVLYMFVLAFVTASAQFIITYCLGLIIDAVPLGHKETMGYFFVIVLTLLFFIVCSALLTYCSGKMTIRLTYSLQNRIGDKICSVQYQDIEQINDGELLSIATKDVEGVKGWFAMLLKIGCIPAQLGLVVILVFWINWKFSLITICLIPLAAIPEVLIAKKLGFYHAEEKKTYASVLSFFTATVEFLLVVKSFQLEDLFCEKNDIELKKNKKARMKRQLREQLVEVYGRCYGHITNSLLLFLGAYFIMIGEMSLGTLTSIILLAGFVGEGLNILNEVPVRLQCGRASAAHIDVLLKLSDELEVGSTPYLVKLQKNLPVYKVCALNYKYGERRVLKNIGFSIWAGEKIAIVGASGCGKTTLFKLLSGLYIPEEGQVFFLGADISRLAPEYLRENIAVTTQETFIFHASFKENIKMKELDNQDDAVIMAGINAQIDEFISSFEQGYDTVVNTTVQSISNGQMQRINLARAFFKNADVFLFDEPTSALDSGTAKLVFDYLFAAHADKTIMVILHNVQDINRFDKIMMLEEGEIVGFGTHDMLLSSCASYQQLYMQGMANVQGGQMT